MCTEILELRAYCSVAGGFLLTGLALGNVGTWSLVGVQNLQLGLSCF